MEKGRRGEVGSKCGMRNAECGRGEKGEVALDK